MLKLGVYKPEQFYASPPRGLWSYVYYRLSRSRVSFSLLRQAETGTAAGAALFERLMPHVQLANGVCRTTFSGRFEDLDPVVNRLLCQAFSSSDPIQVEDWAASACLTSVEWAETLFPLFPHLRFVASDRETFLVEAERLASNEVFIAEAGGRLLQYVRPPFVIRIEPPEPWLLPVNKIAYLWALRVWKDACNTGILTDCQNNTTVGGPASKRHGFAIRQLPLTHPRALFLARNDSRFAIRQHSIFNPAPIPCHAIRSMNILNKAYFSDSELNRGIHVIVSSLKPGGLWVVGRTICEKPREHDVSIFRKTSSGRLDVLERLGAGSEIHDLVLSAK